VTDLPPIPLRARTHLAHATLQAVADVCGADILHIKGAALDASIGPPSNGAPTETTMGSSDLPRLSADADVLVRPAHLQVLLTALKRYGWTAMTRFDTGGGADHSSDLWHEELGWADVHRSFPGFRLDAALAFDRLWLDHRVQLIAQRPCTVPSLDAQRLVLLLHAARNGQSRANDVRDGWTNATATERNRVRELSETLRAEVALASATGHLDDYADRPESELWRLYAVGGASRFEIWRARLKAAQTGVDRLMVLTNPLRLKVDGLTVELWRKPTQLELLRFYCRRLLSDLADIKSYAYKRAQGCREKSLRSTR
jgi:hypothetical protein